MMVSSEVLGDLTWNILLGYSLNFSSKTFKTHDKNINIGIIRRNILSKRGVHTQKEASV